MNGLMVNGKQEFMGVEIPVVYGGFGEGQKVILAREVAKIHGVEMKFVTQLINNNIDEFEEGIDILDLKNSVGQTNSLLELGFSKQSISNSKNIYLLSEQGYMLLVGFMKSNKAKEIRKQLRREYFKMKEVIVSENKSIVEKSNAAEQLVAKIDNTLSDLKTFYRTTHKNKLEINKYIKKCLGINATKENADRVKELLLIQLGYDTYEQVPKDILHDTQTYNKIFDICYMISVNNGQVQMDLDI